MSQWPRWSHLPDFPVCSDGLLLFSSLKGALSHLKSPTSLGCRVFDGRICEVKDALNFSLAEM